MGRAPLQFGVILWRVMRPRVLIAVKQTSMQQLGGAFAVLCNGGNDARC
jgi:hypothetical protein